MCVCELVLVPAGCFSMTTPAHQVAAESQVVSWNIRMYPAQVVGSCGGRRSIGNTSSLFSSYSACFFLTEKPNDVCRTYLAQGVSPASRIPLRLIGVCSKTYFLDYRVNEVPASGM